MSEYCLDEMIDMNGRMAIAVATIEGCREFARLIPEVRSNLVYACTYAEKKKDVLAVDGRITVVQQMPRAAGRVCFGASSHMARLIIEIRRADPTIKAGINFANTPDLTAWLEKYCRERDWIFSCIDRSGEPEEIKETEEASMPWKIKEVIRCAGGQIPKIFYETGAVGKERVSVLVGSDPIEVAEQVCEIARRYAYR